MKRDRFTLILKLLHLNDSTLYRKKGEPCHDPLHKLRPFLEPLLCNFRNNYTLSKEISIDETMIGFKDRLSFIQYYAKKANEMGDEGICACQLSHWIHVQLVPVHRYVHNYYKHAHHSCKHVPCVCVCVCVRARECVRVCVCECAYICMWMCKTCMTCTHICIYLYVCI